MISDRLRSVRCLTERLFSALQRREPEAIAACYEANAIFRAPILGDVLAHNLGPLWRAVFSSTRENALAYTIVDVGLISARVEGVASYVLVFSDRAVTTKFVATLRIRDLRIVYHEDNFDPWLWAQMAYGTRGLALGWSKAWQRRMRGQIRADLRAAALSGPSQQEERSPHWCDK